MCPAVPLRLLRELGFVHKIGPGQAGEVLGGGHQAHGVTRDAKTEGRPYRAAYEWRWTKKGERVASVVSGIPAFISEFHCILFAASFPRQF